MCVISRFMKLILSFSLPWHSLMCRNFLVYFSNYQVIELLSFLYSIQLSSLWLYLWKPFFLWSPRALSQACRVPSKYWFLNISTLGFLRGFLELSHLLELNAIPSPLLAQIPSNLCAPFKETGILAVDLCQEKSLRFLCLSSPLCLSPLFLPASTIYLNPLRFHKMLESDNHQGVSIPLRTEEEALQMTKL